MKIEMPVTMHKTTYNLNFKEAYVVFMWTTEESDSKFPEEMERLNKILQIDGFQIVKWEKRSEYENRLKKVFTDA